MNKENLLKIANYIETIPQEKFDMTNYRTGDRRTVECNSVGCVIGHSTVLFPEIAEKHRVKEDSLWKYNILFTRFSDEVTGLEDKEWRWCFSNVWTDIDNTPTGAAKRIRMLVDGKVTINMLNEWKSWDKPQY